MPMRSRIGARCARWRSMAADAASAARSNAATKLSPSPCSTGRTPPWVVSTSDTARSRRAIASAITGRAVPRVDTLDRILRAAGYATDIGMSRRADATDDERRAKGEELRAALELAAHFPARHAARLRFPRFPHRYAP